MNSLLPLPKLSNHLKEVQRFISPLTKLILAIAVISLAGCATISVYDQQSYAQTTELKKDALELMDLAVNEYSDHEGEVNGFLAEIEKALNYERARPHNEITVEMWEKLTNPDGDLLGSFIKMWKEKGKVSSTFVEGAKGSISEAFDKILELEEGKKKRPQSYEQELFM